MHIFYAVMFISPSCICSLQCSPVSCLLLQFIASNGIHILKSSKIITNQCPHHRTASQMGSFCSIYAMFANISRTRSVDVLLARPVSIGLCLHIHFLCILSLRGRGVGECDVCCCMVVRYVQNHRYHTILSVSFDDWSYIFRISTLRAIHVWQNQNGPR